MRRFPVCSHARREINALGWFNRRLRETSPPPWAWENSLPKAQAIDPAKVKSPPTFLSEGFLFEGSKQVKEETGGAGAFVIQDLGGDVVADRGRKAEDRAGRQMKR
jgi:hypothetical protein